MKCLLSISALLLFVSFFSVTKQEILKGRRCADFHVKPKPRFYKEWYDGKWYVYRLNDYLESLKQDCLLWDYLNITSPFAYSVESSINLGTGELTSYDTTMYFDKNFKGQFQFKYDTETDDEVPEFIKIVDTDYFTYSVEWSCVDSKDADECDYYLYLMTRKRVPDRFAIAAFERVRRRHNFDFGTTRLVVQDDPICNTIN